MSQLLSGLEQVILFIVVFGVVVAFHELGHFLAAKAFDVKVEVFSLGFGSRIFGRKRGETEYRVSIIPLGGYVLMGGDFGDDPDRPRDARDFDAKPVGVRLAIMAAGPVFSALLAVLLMWGAYLAGVEVPAYLREPPRIGSVAEGSPAEKAGLQAGDVVVSASGRRMTTWEGFTEFVLTSPGARLELEVERAGQTLTLPVDVEARGKHRIGFLGAEPCSAVLVRSVSKDSAAERAGLEAGDRILRVNGAEPCSDRGLIEAIQAAEGAPLALVLLRDGREMGVEVTARRDEEAKRWMIGVSPALATVVQRHGVLDALVESCRYNVEKGILVVRAVGKLLTGQLSIRSMSGPLEMASMTQETADVGLLPLIQFVALITLNLAIFNLLPVPILDGGRMLLLGIEAVRGRDLERRTKEWILQAGLAMIVLLMVVVLVVDAIKKWEG